MDQKNRQELEKLIRKRIVSTEEKIVNYEELSQPITPENSLGRLTRMDAINNKSVVEAALQTARDQLGALVNMLNQIEDDDFGLCKRCGEPIPEKRLILIPESSHCVRCAT